MSRVKKEQGAGKRTWGTGSMSPKGPGRWLLRTSHRSTESGERIRVNRVVHARTRRDAEALLAELTGQRASGAAKPKRWTLDRWVRRVYANPELAPRTRETAVHSWELRTSPAFRALLLHEATVDDVDRELERLAAFTSRYGRPLAPRTRAIWYATVRHALNVAVKKRLIPMNPALLTDRAPSSDRSTERPRWTAEETARFIAVAREDRLAALWLLLLEHALRPGEAFALTWDDLKGNMLTVRRALTRLRDGTAPIGPTKTHAVRSCELSDDLAAALKAHRTRQKAERFKAGRHYHAALNLIFGTELGEPLRHDVTTRQYKRLVKQAGAPALHLYGLRHTNASLKAEADVDPARSVKGSGTRIRESPCAITPSRA